MRPECQKMQEARIGYSVSSKGCILNLGSCILHPVSYTLNPESCILHLVQTNHLTKANPEL